MHNNQLTSIALVKKGFYILSLYSPHNFFPPGYSCLEFTGTVVCDKFETIINSTTLLKDVKKMSNAEQTSYVESFHALINHFAPKMKAFKYHGMVSR